MPREEFEKLVGEEFPMAVPEQFRGKIQNVALLIEDEPSPALRKEGGLGRHQTLLGLYLGIPTTARGDYYGVGATVPDTITLFQRPIEESALAEGKNVRQVIRDTIWHEVAHHFGYDERQVRGREQKRGVKKEFSAIIRGRVQMVMYRDFAKRKAQRCGISGTVRNLPDGTVEVIAQGEVGVLNTYLKKLRRGPWLAKVERVAVAWREPARLLSDFTIL